MSIKAGLHAPSHCSLFPGKFPQLAIPPETYHQWTCLHVLTACLSIQPLPCDNCSIFHQLQAAGALLSPHPFASLFLLPYRCVGHTHGPPSLLQVRNSSPSSPMPTAPNQMPYISLHSSSKLNTKNQCSHGGQLQKLTSWFTSKPLPCFHVKMNSQTYCVFLRSGVSAVPVVSQ